MALKRYGVRVPAAPPLPSLSPPMFYVYVLRSERNGRYYIGSTGDLANRILQRNAGMTKSTKALRPWELIYQEQFKSLAEARRREAQLKSWKNRTYLESQLNLPT